MAFNLCFKTSPGAHNLSYENEFDLQDNERARKPNFKMEGLCTNTRFETEVRAIQKRLIESCSSVKTLAERTELYLQLGQLRAM